nr:MAG TPA: hypothetical protein [Caudoviricetes sp.]
MEKGIVTSGISGAATGSAKAAAQVRRARQPRCGSSSI